MLLVVRGSVGPHQGLLRTAEEPGTQELVLAVLPHTFRTCCTYLPLASLLVAALHSLVALVVSSAAAAAAAAVLVLVPGWAPAKPESAAAPGVATALASEASVAWAAFGASVAFVVSRALVLLVLVFRKEHLLLLLVAWVSVGS